jgi:transposase InsO family protein
LTLSFVLRELSVVEQRYQAVLAVIRDGHSVVDVASRWEVSRQTVHTWLRRYEDGGLDGLADRSHRPEQCPHQMTPVVEAAVLEWRRTHPGWGPRRLAHEAVRAGLTPVPSRSGIYRALLRAGLIDPTARRRRDRRWKRWERARPMELWQMDLVGGMGLADGGELKILTGVDDHSRYCVVAAVMRRATGRAVCQAFTTALSRHGVPAEILTDNGKQFTGRFNRPPVEVLFDRICRENGIEHALTKPRSPTTTGKIERFHRSLREELLTGQVFADPAAAQAALDAWVEHYNTQRPHQGIEMATPHERFWRREQPLPGSPELPVEASAVAATSVAVVAQERRAGEAWVARRVGANGVICVSWQQFSVGKHHGGANVDVHVGPELLHVYLADTLIKTVVRNSRGEVRKKRASVAQLTDS